MLFRVGFICDRSDCFSISWFPRLPRFLLRLPLTFLFPLAPPSSSFVPLLLVKRCPPFAFTKKCCERRQNSRTTISGKMVSLIFSDRTPFLSLFLFFLNRTYSLDWLCADKLTQSFVCGIPRPTRTPQSNCSPDAGLHERDTFSTPIVGLAGTGYRTRAAWAARSRLRGRVHLRFGCAVWMCVHGRMRFRCHFQCRKLKNDNENAHPNYTCKTQV
jgi:hypothetical protein